MPTCILENGIMLDAGAGATIHAHFGATSPTLDPAVLRPTSSSAEDEAPTATSDTVDGSAAYTATKAAIRGLVAWFGKNFARAGIPVRVNGMYPGLIETDMTRLAVESETYGPMLLKGIPMGRFGQPSDCANAVLFLASDASSWMTAQHVIIDGGQVA